MLLVEVNTDLHYFPETNSKKVKAENRSVWIVCSLKAARNEKAGKTQNEFGRCNENITESGYSLRTKIAQKRIPFLEILTFVMIMHPTDTAMRSKGFKTVLRNVLRLLLTLSWTANCLIFIHWTAGLNLWQFRFCTQANLLDFKTIFHCSAEYLRFWWPIIKFIPCVVFLMVSAKHLLVGKDT